MNPSEYFSQRLDSKQPDLARQAQAWDRRAEEVGAFTVARDDMALHLVRQHMDLSGKAVLDISFGAGRHLLEFLRQGARISGVEISAGMVAQAHRKLRASGLPYPPDNLVQSAWETLDLSTRGWDQAFDLVFLHKSPAISSVAMLKKVLQASRQAVCISLYTHREDSLLQDLLLGFGLMRDPGGIRVADDLLAIFNLLYAWGYLPQLQFEEHSKTSRHDPDRIVDRYASWLWRGADCTETRRRALRDTLRHRAVDSKVDTRHRDIVGHLLVDVRRRQPGAGFDDHV
ncbi:class I SAM-dependent methyltransferase [Castellaniella hirudinis]|uniref:class I SAM-dependent methyltransferase n=1 Tax=Castellaniella hirudinis TaxID=1144617 RepID=UPI0039C24DFD